MKLLKKVIDKIRDKFLSDEEYARRIGVKIGKHCYISTRRFPSEAYLISIGDYVRIAPNTMFSHMVDCGLYEKSIKIKILIILVK